RNPQYRRRPRLRQSDDDGTARLHRAARRDRRDGDRNDQNAGAGLTMRELVRTNNPALLSYIEALLKDAGLSFFIADRNISVVEGSIGAFPRPVLVAEEDEPAARRLLADA